MSNDIRVAPTTSVQSAPRWWAAPLLGTLLAPLVAAAVSGTDNTFADRTFLMAGGVVLAYAVILPSWFLSRAPALGRRRIHLAAVGCALAAMFPAMISTLGWMVFLVALFTGHVDG
ncbi:hypothetical protein [Streptomyces sp. NPDC059166]|uniref:hypothetical protein n=1 Tax=Streptomyces sp. NPDC059166 TaxID=3346752 RepID=UPI0036AF42C1